MLPSRILYYTNIVKGESKDKTEKHRFYSLGTAEPNPIFYKYSKNSQKNGKIWINKVSVWY